MTSLNNLKINFMHRTKLRTGVLYINKEGEGEEEEEEDGEEEDRGRKGCVYHRHVDYFSFYAPTPTVC